MSGVATAIGGSAVLGAVVSSQAAGKQSAAAGQANALQGQALANQQANEAPYQAAGVNALAQEQAPKFQQDFNQSMFKESPGYQFSLQQGQNALNAANAASGNNVSGSGLAALSNYNVGSANQEYQQAFNNYQTQQGNQFSRLQAIAGMGAGANAQSNAANQNYGNQAGANGMAGADAQAAGMMGAANTLGQGALSFANARNVSNPSAPPGSGYSTMSQWAGAPESNLQAPSADLGYSQAAAPVNYLGAATQ